jgi:hypothetical protein
MSSRNTEAPPSLSLNVTLTTKLFVEPIETVSTFVAVFNSANITARIASASPGSSRASTRGVPSGSDKTTFTPPFIFAVLCFCNNSINKIKTKFKLNVAIHYTLHYNYRKLNSKQCR